MPFGKDSVFSLNTHFFQNINALEKNKSIRKKIYVEIPSKLFCSHMKWASPLPSL